MFTQIVNPTGNLLLTWIIALFPVVALLILLAVVRLSAWAATLIGSILTFLLGLYVWRMPLGDGIRAYLYGSATGIWIPWGRMECSHSEMRRNDRQRIPRRR